MQNTAKKQNPIKRFISARGVGQVLTVFVGLIILCAIFYWQNPNFLGKRNIANLLRQIAPWIIVGIGQGYVLITANIDLSIGSVVGMSCMMIATLICNGMNPIIAFFIALATDNTAAGKLAGETLLAALTEAGVTEGKIGVVNVNAATVSTLQRATGFRQAFEGTGFEILEDVYTDGDAAKSQEAATNFITDGVVALFGANEGTTVGVGNAIKAEGEGCAVKAVGFDKSDAILNLVADGYLVATTAQNPYNMGYYGIQTAVEYLKNGTTEFENVDTGATMLTAQYIADNGLLG